MDRYDRAEEIAQRLREIGSWDGELVEELCKLADISEEDLDRMRETEAPVEIMAETAAEILGVDVYGY